MPKVGNTISVITAVYNNEQTLQRCLDSFASQDYPHKELIVIDGRSSDRSADIIRDNAHAIAYWESEQDTGVYHAWNKALDHIAGDWVHFLGADDFYHDDHVLSRVGGWLQSCDPDTSVVYGRVAISSEAGEVVEMSGLPWHEAKPAFKKEMSIFHAGVFHHRRLFEIHGRFDESFRIAGDYEFLLRELKSGTALFMDDVVVVACTIGGLSSSPELAVTLRREDARARRLNGVFPYPLAWCKAYTKAVAYKLLFRFLGKDSANRLRGLYRRVAHGRPLNVQETRPTEQP